MDLERQRTWRSSSCFEDRQLWRKGKVKQTCLRVWALSHSWSAAGHLHCPGEVLTHNLIFHELFLGWLVKLHVSFAIYFESNIICSSTVVVACKIKEEKEKIVYYLCPQYCQWYVVIVDFPITTDDTWLPETSKTEMTTK